MPLKRAMPSIVFIVLGTCVASLTMLPNWFPHMNEFSARDASPRWWRDVLVQLAGATLVAAALRVFMDRATKLAQRPGKFALLVLLGASAATAFMWVVLSGLKHLRLTDIAPAALIDTWWQTLLWGGLVGWLYVLTLQRDEDQAQLDALRLRRAMLARQLARSRLGAARAQVDPAMVARVLREVHRRYRTDPAPPALLLEHLISYLRLAMQRTQLAAPGASADSALVRAFVALHEAEYGASIACTLAIEEAAGGQPAAPPLFQLVRTLLDAAAPARAPAMRLDCTVRTGQMRVALALQGKAMGTEERIGLGAALARLLPGTADPLQYLIAPGVHTYVVCSTTH